MKKDLIKELFEVNVRLNSIGRKFFEINHTMTRSEFLLMKHVMYLQEKDEKQTITQVAKTLHLSNAAVSRTIKNLLDRGWLVREKLAEDRRNGIIKSSKEGKEIFQEFTIVLNQEIEKAFFKVSHEELVSVIDSIKSLIEKIDLKYKNE